MLILLPQDRRLCLSPEPDGGSPWRHPLNFRRSIFSRILSRLSWLAILLLGFALLPGSQAASLYRVRAIARTPIPVDGAFEFPALILVDVTARGNNVADLLDDAIRAQGKFIALTNTSIVAYDIAVFCRGVTNPIVFRMNLTNGVYTITGPRSILLTRNSRKALAGEMAQLIQRHPRDIIPNVTRSLLSVSDGHPEASTALAA